MCVCVCRSLRIFGLLYSSSNSQRFSRCVFRPSSGISCQNREPARNFQLNPFIQSRAKIGLISLTITGYKCKALVSIACYFFERGIEPSISR